MKMTVLFITGALMMVVAGTAVAQQDRAPNIVLVQAEPAQETVTGCLTKGDHPGEFYIAEGKEQKTAIVATEDLSSHAGKQVRVTGTKDIVGNKTVFKVTKVDVVAEACGTASS